MGSARSWLYGVLFSCICMVSESTAPGAVKLDNYTIHKVLSIPGFTFLVKFDQSYAYGFKEDQFRILCKHAYSTPSVLIGEVPIQEYGDRENQDLKDKYLPNVEKANFPVYLLFQKGLEDPEMYAGTDGKAENIVSWMRRKGVAIPSLGTLDLLDSVAKQFIKDKFSEEHVEAAKKLAEKEFKGDRKAPMYLRIMDKVKEKGQAYISSEMQRIEKMLEGKIGAGKAGELSDKLKILQVFKDEL
eukprot:TRINITY_DN3509_c1_g1_i1.p1 TRINITY_DN3509_c1_g1~~TRINITY_DN3509_c1_g1_i1.p1  ORF type:complete len:243 (+),score=45.40 TRINITY_DN3509_c1_g1_i1:63-791(+)